MKKLLRTIALAAVVAAPAIYANAEITGAGTEADPYLIGTAEDLGNAYTKTAWTDHVVYFRQTADIDMAGVTAYKPVNGGNANYTTAIYYDGDNHVIKNFAPASEKAVAEESNYYNTSIFGVLTGTVKNLGVVDANIDITAEGAFGTGVLAGYAGHGNAAALAPTTLIENVYVTGKVVAKGPGCGYSGGLIGTTGSDVTIKNSYANVTLEALNNCAGICGRVRNTLTLENVYAAGTVDCAGAAGLIASSDKTDKTVKATNVIAFNSGAAEAANSVVLTGEIKVADDTNKADLIAEVQGWEAFSGSYLEGGYPALAWAAPAPGTEANPYIIATAEDLCNAYSKTAWTDHVVYFLQTEDIDMAGVTAYKPVNGGNGNYTTAIYYDGGNHVIKNFAPASEKPVAGESNYYNTSIFGVLTGTVKNLGVVDANIDITAEGAFGTGVLAGYAGHGNAAALAPVTTIENVYVTGKVVAKGDGCGYSGGFIGTTGSDVVIKNAYANVTLEANNNCAGICGRLRNALTLENVYAAGTVDCAGASALIVSSDKTDKAVSAKNVIAFNSGAAEAANSVALTGEIKVADDTNKAALIAEVQGWEGFSATVLDGGYPALVWATAPAPAEPDGTEANPYIIATAEDLCNAYAKTAWTDHVVYFLQTEDIDMAGVTAYKPVNGGNGNYTTAIYYDGGNHVIKNFAPASEKPVAGESNYYNTSIFGVLTGTVKNLGVVDVNIDITAEGAFGTGVLAGYAGHGNAAALAPTTTIENVYVSGKLVAKGDGCGYSGGFIGTTGSDVTIKNAYANVALEANNNCAGICGRLRNALTLENVYAAGTVDCAGASALIVSSDKTDKAVSAKNVIAFNSGAAEAANSVALTGEIKVADDANKAALIAEVQGWEAFSNTLYYKGYPALSWQTDATTDGPVTGVDNIAVDANAPVEYFNLQGVRVANPENGVYLRRQGNKVSKVLVK